MAKRMPTAAISPVYQRANKREEHCNLLPKYKGRDEDKIGATCNNWAEEFWQELKPQFSKGQKRTVASTAKYHG